MDKSDDKLDLIAKALEKNASSMVTGSRRLAERDLNTLMKLAENDKKLSHIGASKRHLYDDHYARNPTAICGNTSIGLPACDKGEGRHCYWLGKCESKINEDELKIDENGNEVLPKLPKEISKGAIKDAASKYPDHEIERMAGDYAYGLLQAINEFKEDE